MHRIRIFQPIVPEYRVALFEGISRRYGGNVEVWAAHNIGTDVSVPLQLEKVEYDHQFVRIGPFLWQRGLSLDGLRRGDVIVVCGDIHQLSSIVISICARFRGVKVVWWGHHKTATSSAIGVRIRLAIAKVLSDVMLTYTNTGADYLVTQGFDAERVFATGNTIDQRPIATAIKKWGASNLKRWREGQGVSDKKILLCCSVLREKVRLDIAISAIAIGNLPTNVVLAVIGDGPMRQEYEQLARRLGVEDRVLWLGVTRNQDVMAPWFMAAEMFVYPGSIGLSILHSFSYGLPVVVHDNAEHQMPEYEIMENGMTGLVFKEGSVEDMSRVINLLLMDKSGRAVMSRYVKKVAYERYSMDNMIGNFCSAIDCAVTM